MQRELSQECKDQIVKASLLINDENWAHFFIRGAKYALTYSEIYESAGLQKAVEWIPVSEANIEQGKLYYLASGIDMWWEPFKFIPSEKTFGGVDHWVSAGKERTVILQKSVTHVMPFNINPPKQQ